MSNKFGYTTDQDVSATDCAPVHPRLLGRGRFKPCLRPSCGHQTARWRPACCWVGPQGLARGWEWGFIKKSYVTFIVNDGKLRERCLYISKCQIHFKINWSKQKPLRYMSHNKFCVNDQSNNIFENVVSNQFTTYLLKPRSDLRNSLRKAQYLERIFSIWVRLTHV